MWLMAQLVLYVARIFFCNIPLQEPYRLHVAVEAEAGKGLDAGHAGVGYLPEALAGRDIRYVYLHCGKRDGLERVEYRDARVRIGSLTRHIDSVRNA